MKRFGFNLLLGVLILSASLNAQESNPLCANPLMGYNSYDSYGNGLNEETAKKLIDIMAGKYLRFGYKYFVIDAGWYSNNHVDKNGLPEPSKVYFPGGIKALADYAHSKGLKFGLWNIRGVLRLAIKQNCIIKGTNIPIKDIVDTLSICTWDKSSYGVDMSKDGSFAYYKSRIDQLASWGVDFIKYDDITGFPKEINAVSKAVENCRRPSVLSLSPGDDTKLQFLPFYENCNMLRTTPDVWDNQFSLENGFKAMKIYQGRGISNFWPDLDMIALGPLQVNQRTRRQSKFDENQAYTFLTQRAIFASPLIIGGDMLTMDDFTYTLLTNKEMIDCDQNGVSGVLTYDKDSLEIYVAVNKDDPGKGWLAVFNRNSLAEAITVKKSDFGFNYNNRELHILMKNYRLHDIWNKKDYYLMDSLKLFIPRNGVFFADYSEL